MFNYLLSYTLYFRTYTNVIIIFIYLFIVNSGTIDSIMLLLFFFILSINIISIEQDGMQSPKLFMSLIMFGLRHSLADLGHSISLD